MTPQDIPLWRLHHQQILDPVLTEPGKVVSRLCAVQAQDFTGALWSVGLRMHDATINDIRKAIDRRTIVRTWLIRGTLHFATPEDVRWILGLVAPRIIAGSAGRHRQLGLTKEDFTRSRGLFSEELKGGRQFTRDEMFHALEKAGISPDGQRGYHILAMAGLDGLICFGSMRGKEQTFVLLDEWAPEKEIQERKDARADLARRYFTGHGPATLQDFVWWSGLKVSDAKAGIQQAGPAISRLTSGGKEYFLPDSAPGPVPEDPAAYLLPGFDEYVLGYRDRDVILDTSVTKNKYIGANGMMLPTIVTEGSVTGTWKRKIGKREISVMLQPFSPLSSIQKRSINTSVDRYGKFMRMPAVAVWP